MIYCNSVECYKLLEQTIDIKYPLQEAADNTSAAIMKYLIEDKKVDVNLADDKGHTALWYLQELADQGLDKPNATGDLRYRLFDECKQLLQKHGASNIP